jgi:diguanylate cyclase (GGDEF)-like protein
MAQESTIRVLLVEDNADDVAHFQQLVGDSSAGRIALTTVGLIRDALNELSQNAHDILLLDLTLPDGRGLSNLNQVQAIAPTMPVIVISNLNDERLALHAVKAGAQDYLVKGRIDSHVLVRVMRYAIERKRVDERLAYLAHYDVLTELPNRTLFRDRMTRAFAHAQRYGHSIALLFLDLDHFKSINDTLGHDAGDQLLKTVARRLESCVRKNDTIARLGGDEFTIVLEDVSSADDIASVAQKILDTMSRSFALDSHEVFVTVSIGIAFYPSCGLDPVTLIKNADTALYAAKEQGRSCFKFYNPQMHLMASERLATVTALRHAVQRKEFVLHYQPLLEPRAGRIHGVEALLRWNHPGKGLISPGQFIALLEDTGLIITVGEWVLRAACAQARSLAEQGLPALRMNVNVSMRQFRQPDFVNRVANIIEETGADPKMLQIEVTESVLADNVPATTAKLRALRAIGILTAIDDFGTGYCSLSYLKQFPIHSIKIDRTFIKDIETGSNDAAIANAIIALGHSLSMEVVAEGVETENQLAFLKGQGCDIVQGFYYSEPMPGDALPTWLRENIPPNVHYLPCP